MGERGSTIAGRTFSSRFNATARCFRNVEELLGSIGEFIDNHNRQPKPFIWTAKASDILEKVKRAQAVLA